MLLPSAALNLNIVLNERPGKETQLLLTCRKPTAKMSRQSVRQDNLSLEGVFSAIIFRKI